MLDNEMPHFVEAVLAGPTMVTTPLTLYNCLVGYRKKPCVVSLGQHCVAGGIVLRNRWLRRSGVFVLILELLRKCCL